MLSGSHLHAGTSSNSGLCTAPPCTPLHVSRELAPRCRHGCMCIVHPDLRLLKGLGSKTALAVLSCMASLEKVLYSKRATVLAWSLCEGYATVQYSRQKLLCLCACDPTHSMHCCMMRLRLAPCCSPPVCPFWLPDLCNLFLQAARVRAW